MCVCRKRKSTKIYKNLQYLAWFTEQRIWDTLTLEEWQVCQQKEDRKEALWAFCVLPKMFTMRYPLTGSINLYPVEFRSVEY